MLISDWIYNNYIEVFGAITGVLYVFLEIRQSVWLWPVGIVTSAVYVWIFFSGKLYADMSLQGYYLAISFIGWYWWVRSAAQPPTLKLPRSKEGTGQDEEEEKGRTSTGSVGEGENKTLNVSRITQKLTIVLTFVFLILYVFIWQALSRLTDSPVPGWDAFITSLSIVATWMLARKIYEHWYLWIIVNIVAGILFFSRALYPTVILYLVYCVMSFVGLRAWRIIK